MGLKEDIDNFRKQGYSDSQIQQYLIQKGYDQKQVSSLLFQNIQKEVRKSNTSLILILIILSLVVMVNLAIFIYNGMEHYSDDPEEWIIEENDSRIIDIEEISQGQDYIDQAGEQQSTELGTVFISEGWYEGEYFERFYEKDDRIIMKITEDITPDDNIIEGYVAEKLEDDKLYAYIFIDSDWKRALPNTKVYWGKYYENSTLFDFSNEISDGIFMMRIEDDMERFAGNFSVHYGGFYVGELDDKNTSTLISFN